MTNLDDSKHFALGSEIVLHIGGAATVLTAVVIAISATQVGGQRHALTPIPTGVALRF